MNKKNVIAALVILLLLPTLSLAIYDWYPLQQNQLFHGITNSGQLGQIDGGSGSYGFWPAPALDANGNIIPPAMNYVYGWGLWVGALIKSATPGKTLDTMVTVGYNPNNSTGEYTAGAVTLGIPEDPGAENVKIYISTEADWPLQKTNGQDSVISMCDTRCSYNDYRTSVHAPGGVPLKIEITQTTYQWNVPQLQDLIYFLFEVKNTGVDTLYNIYLAPTADLDIGTESGTSANDVCHFDTTTNMAYQYQVDNTEPGWTRTPGCIGMSFLQGPIATKDYTFPDARQIYAGDTLGLIHFKVFNIAVDPPDNVAQYKELAGYDYTTGNYVPYDPKPSPGDCRFMESTGPIDIAPGQTAKVIVCMICANFDYTYMNINDTLAIKELREKARVAKIVFENSIVQNGTQISITAPAESTVISGTQSITWTYGGNATSSDTVDLYYTTNGYTWDSLAFDQPNNGSYSWSTANGPDGIKYQIAAILHGPLKLASSVTGLFVVNNPGNATPEVSVFGPDSAISGNYNWRWMAGDADQDELFASHFVMREGTSAWQKVVGMLSSLPNNTQHWLEYQYTWNTDTMMNANYKMKSVCYDGQETKADSTTAYYALYNPRVNYPGSNTGESGFPIWWYTYNPALISGHSYEVRFKSIVRGAYNSTNGKYAAEYKYDLWDMTSASLVSSDWVIPNEYTDAFYYDDNTGQPHSGFAVLGGDTTFKPGLGVIDSLKRPTTDPSVDTLSWLSITSPDMGWAKLNGNYEIRWHVVNDTLWPEVWETNYGVSVPFDSTGLNNVTIPAWNIGGSGAGLGRRYVTSAWPSSGALSYVNLCGYRVYFNRGSTYHKMTWATHPLEGDIWRIYCSGPIPPRDGDVYSFTPTGVEGAPNENNIASLLLNQNAPNPFRQQTTINFQIPKSGVVNLKVYNIAGQLVKTLASGQAAAGYHSVKWDGRDDRGNKVSSGVYIYRLQAGNRDLSRKLVILR